VTAVAVRHTQRHLASIRRRDGHTIDGTPGDCLRACVATVLGETDDLSLPHFAMASDYWRALRAWSVRHRGLDWACTFVDRDYAGAAVIGQVRPGDVTLSPWAAYWAGQGPGLAIVGGHSPRGAFLHAVVGNVHGEVLWDPHPSRAGLVDVVDVILPVPPLALAGYWPGQLELPAPSAEDESCEVRNA
jgi:hypothetical protein